MARVTWKEGKVFSIKLRNSKYALLQMLDTKGFVAVFDQFRDNDSWNDIKLKQENVLFYSFIIAKTIFPHSKVNVQSKISSCSNLSFPNKSISQGTTSKKVRVWEGTDLETEIMILSGQLHVREYTDEKRFNWKERAIGPSDYKNVIDLELSNLRIYPEFNERLYLCSLFEKNIDPLKEILFGRELPKECKTYVDIIGGKTKLTELGY